MYASGDFSASQKNAYWPKDRYSLTENFYDDGERDGDNQSHESPKPAPQRQADENDEGGNAQIFSLNAWLNDVSQNQVDGNYGNSNQKHWKERRIPLNEGKKNRDCAGND